MPLLPKLSPLQSRFAASLVALIMVLALYLAFSIPQFAYAAEVDSIGGDDHNHERLLDRPYIDIDIKDLELREAGYEAEFIGYDRGIIGRAPAANEPTPLINNRLVQTNIEQGQTLPYSFLNASVFGDLSPNTTGFPSPVRIRRLSTGLEYEDDVLDDGLEWMDGEDGNTQDHELRRRQSTSEDHRTVYITATTCVQPQPIINTTTDSPPQLELYVSLSTSNTNPGPGQDPSSQQMVTLDGGFGMIVVNATGDVFMGLYGPNTTAYKSVWNAQLAASIDAPFHFYHNGTNPNLYLVDSDSSSALLITGDLTDEPSNSTVYQEWLESATPYVIFAGNRDDTSLNGLQNSYCGLTQSATIVPAVNGEESKSVTMGITTRGNNQPKQQFYIDTLGSGSTYNVFLATNANSTGSVVGGGGQVWPMTNFTTLTGMSFECCLAHHLTLADGNCGVIFDLSFCTQTAYAVPSNPQNFPNFTALAAFYDNATLANYQIFEKVLAQIPCETTSSAQYSLARTCTDCAAAYKEWLCSVTIPRCTDFSSDLSWLQERAMGQPFPNGTFLPEAQISFANNSVPLNSSRNPSIDDFVTPGPYKEVLPCDDLCHQLVQSCPASMGFSCPRPGRIGYNSSYGQMPDPKIPGQIGQITCNYPGAAYDQLSGAAGFSLSILYVALAVTSIMFI
ncbi:Calcium influx-promoting ehs1 [Hyphodiscus hymeniophilus]|uniref:Calcium influx-promoting ehs1 n=1 Tax=Hyphodiscus hymeniophilus TaxID=353542 RepID=A0A9P6VII2_9HELO|nr:Calcium influx-promoting ehs1 [Hyphodiscus hymeniophilus]